jgi:hypothetical protein
VREDIRLVEQARNVGKLGDDRFEFGAKVLSSFGLFWCVRGKGVNPLGNDRPCVWFRCGLLFCSLCALLAVVSLFTQREKRRVAASWKPRVGDTQRSLGSSSRPSGDIR